MSDVMVAFKKRTIESVLDLLAEIMRPVVPFSKDQGEMAREAVEFCQAKAREARQLLGGE